LFLAATSFAPLVLPAWGDDASSGRKSHELVSLGEEIFNREWVPGDARSPAGDGLGPVYNETSCVACHNLGGVGGAGAASKNITILSVVADRRTSAPVVLDDPFVPSGAEKSPVLASMIAFVQSENARLAKQVGATTRTKSAPTERVALGNTEPAKRSTAAPQVDHPGLKSAASATLHRFGTDPAYDDWRKGVLRLGRMAAPRRISDEKTGVQRFGPNPAEVTLAIELEAQARLLGRQAPFPLGDAVVVSSDRNTTPLFGDGLIDTIPDAAIEAVVAEQAASKSSTIHGRASRLSEGRIGKFGWKGQIANLKEFVLSACAVELGLEVPGHHQSPDPLATKDAAAGLDLSAHECDALTAFVASLPTPLQRTPFGTQEKERIEAGSKLFASIGCATCHRPKLGDVEGLYSDLLLHDMGPSLGGTGSYSGSRSSDSTDGRPVAANLRRLDAGKPLVSAGPQEWRTPPLWGLRDSGPYLHDGRATTLEQAIAIHGGEASSSAEDFAGLEPNEKVILMSFLKSLVAPTIGMAQRGAP